MQTCRTKMAIMLRYVHGTAKKIKEVDSTALTYAGVAKGKGKGKGAAKGAALAKGQGAKGKGSGKGSGGKGASGTSCAVCRRRRQLFEHGFVHRQFVLRPTRAELRVIASAA